MSSNYLTKFEVNTFLTNHLHLTADEFAGSRPSLPLLQKICTAFDEHVPYSTIQFFHIPVEQRDLPTLEQVKQTGLHKLGGMCYETNVFLHWLLAGCGFDVAFLLAKVYSNTFYNHVCNVVHVEGRDYLIDGNSFPVTSEKLLCLDFKGDVSAVSDQSIWKVKLERKMVDGHVGYVGKFLLNANNAMPYWKLPTDEEGWATYTEFPLVRRGLDDVAEPLRSSYKDPLVAPVINRIFVQRLRKGRLLLMRNTVLFYEVEGRVRQRVQATTRDELVHLLRENFGEYFPLDIIQGAVDKYIEFVGVPPGFSTS